MCDWTTVGALALAALAIPAASVAAAAAIQGRGDASPQAARAVVACYYAALDRGAYRTAYRLWVDSGRASGQTLDAFTRGFARTAHTRVVAGPPTRPEGAAGSLHVTVPVRVEAVRRDGARERFTGHYVLRRVNGVPGATPDQLTWHIASARLHEDR